MPSVVKKNLTPAGRSCEIVITAGVNIHVENIYTSCEGNISEI
jgi:hypothetical protein